MADSEDQISDGVRAAVGLAMERQISAKVRQAANEYLMTFGSGMALHEFSTIAVPAVLAMVGDDDEKAAQAAAYAFKVALAVFDAQLEELIEGAMREGVEVPQEMLARFARIRVQKGQKADG